MLQGTLIIDYQNVHLTGYQLFGLQLPIHNHYIDPGKFADELITIRNSKMRPGYEMANVSRILVFRGLPSNDYDSKAYARNLAQAANWQKDPRVQVTHRPLKYVFKRDGDGNNKLISKQEKGIDVLCAINVFKFAQTEDLVILASQDTDLLPAIEEASNLNKAKLETVSWYQKGMHSSRELRSSSVQLWNTRLGQDSYFNSRDLEQY